MENKLWIIVISMSILVELVNAGIYEILTDFQLIK